VTIGFRGASEVRGFLRRNRSVAMPARSLPAPAPGGMRPGGSVGALISGLAIKITFVLYGFLLRRRRRFNRMAQWASTWVASITSRKGAGGRLLDLAKAQISAKRYSLARPLLTVIELGIILSIQINLAASHKVSAVRLARVLNLLFRQKVVGRRGLAANTYFITLSYCGFYDRICREVPEPESIDSEALNFAIGMAHLYRSYDVAARFFMERAARSGTAQAERKLGCVHLLAGRLGEAASCFAKSIERDPKSVMAHQNYAGFYNSAAYHPSDWELKNGGELLIYDSAMQLGESFYLQGRFEDTFRCYQLALQFQAKFALRWPLPNELRNRIASNCAGFDLTLPVRLLGYEWVTLIGHFGFLDSYILMSKLSMIDRANYVLLAPVEKVVNQPLLRLFEPHFCIIRDPLLVDELLPYQRSIGDQFMAFNASDGSAEPWPHAAARAQVEGSSRKMPALVELSAAERERGRMLLREAGLPDDAWYVSLHIREGGFHGDGAGSTREHRSADIESYLSTVAEITARGGWVIRLGDSSMASLPPLPNVFDYARSAIKSPEMDVYLLETSRLFIGTTSGLTSAAQIFRRPMLLVNCISNDCQYWTDQTDFIVKLVFDKRRRRYLSLRETYSQPIQSLLIDGAVMHRQGYEVHANSAEDIRAAAAEKLDLLSGVTTRPGNADPTMVEYREALAKNPFAFGAASPSLSFLRSHPELLYEPALERN
jgi:putative glycosyltransferase (TIGR04372 family)